MDSEILEILKKTGALLEGHFLLSSGKHSNQYVQCARVLRFPFYAEKIMKIVCEKVSHLDVDVIVGPAIGGIITSYEMGRQLGLESIFSERIEGQMTLRRGFTVNKGAKILISEDVITTGKSSLEVKNLMEKMGAIVLGIACIVDRRPNHIDIGLPVYSGIQLELQIFDEKDCPLCHQGIELVKPGSRAFEKKYMDV
ncbi:MAG: orotate phosphoribosyltransferase [Candidatus Atribacteria bacterium]|nr:orotate phosphoribosyltransferase [Candidatus Atribacteria bacterium]